MQEYLRLRVSLGQFLILTLDSCAPTAAGRPGLHTRLNCKHHCHIFMVFVLLEHPESTCCSEPWWFQFPRLRTSIDVWPSSFCAVQTSPRRWLWSYLIFFFFLTRVFHSKNNYLASQAGWGILTVFSKLLWWQQLFQFHIILQWHLEDIFLNSDSLNERMHYWIVVPVSKQERFWWIQNKYSIVTNEFICLSYKFSWLSGCIQLHFWDMGCIYWFLF